MEQKLNVRALKGAPLSIIITLMLQGGKTVSHGFLCQETGYSDRTVTQGLEYLVSNQIVSRCGHSGFALTGENYQLPLYFDEKIEPLNPSPASIAEPVLIPEAAPEKFSGEKINPEIVKITTLEKEVENLKSEILRLSEAVKALQIVNSTKTEPEIVNSAPLINESINTDTKIIQDSLIDSGNDLSDIVNWYKAHNRDGLEYTDDQFKKLTALYPDSEVLEFILPRASSFEVAFKWAQYDLKHAKYHLLKYFGIAMPALQRITENKEISLWQIDYHYWHWYLVDQDRNRNLTLGWAVKKIENGYDRQTAENAPVAKYRYI